MRRMAIALLALLAALSAQAQTAPSWNTSAKLTVGARASYSFTGLTDSTTTLDATGCPSIAVWFDQDIVSPLTGANGTGDVYSCPIPNVQSPFTGCTSLGSGSGTGVPRVYIGPAQHLAVDVTGDPTDMSAFGVSCNGNVAQTQGLLNFAISPGVGTANGVVYADASTPTPLLFRSNCTIDPVTGIGPDCPPLATANQIRKLCEAQSQGGHCITWRIGAVDGVDVLPGAIAFNYDATGRTTTPSSLWQDCVSIRIEGTGGVSQRVLAWATRHTQASQTNPIRGGCSLPGGAAFGACTATILFEACPDTGATAGNCGAAGGRNRTTTSLVVDQGGLVTAPVWNTSGSTVWNQTAGEAVYAGFTPGGGAGQSTPNAQVTLCAQL